MRLSDILLSHKRNCVRKFNLIFDTKIVYQGQFIMVNLLNQTTEDRIRSNS